MMKRKPGQTKATLRLPQRVATLDIREERERVTIKLRFSKYGDFGDLWEISDWLLPYFVRYDDDPRPVVIDHPMTGEVVSIYGDSNSAFGLIRQCNG